MLSALQPKLHDDSRVEELEEELRSFSYIVSHDLMTVLRQLGELARLVERDASNNAPIESRLSAMREVSGKGQVMVKALLAYSALQQRDLQIQRLEMDAVVRAAVGQLARAIHEAGATVEIAVAGTVDADAALLTEAVKTLIDNAIKFPRQDAPIHVLIEGRDNGDGTWRCRVHDNGRGLEEKYWLQAFQMFWKGEPGEAAGAGLAICRRIARRHGGDVAFLAEGAGTCIALTLPCKAGAAL